MEKKTYEIAKRLRDQIQHFEVKQTQIRNITEREGDTDFNMLRQLAYDGCQFAINHLEKEFQEL
jgi:hypothetical protein